MSRPARSDPRTHPGPHRRRHRRRALRARLRPRGASAAQGPQSEQGVAADPGSRPGPIVLVRDWAGGTVRSALDAVLPDDLLSLSLLPRHRDDDRQRHPDRDDARHRDLYPATRSGRDRAGPRAQHARRGDAAQRRGPARHGHGRTDRRRLGRDKQQIHGRQPARGRCRRRPRRGVAGTAPPSPVAGARDRRLSRYRAEGERRHHHRGLDHLGARACAGGAGDRSMARLYRRAPELAPAQRVAHRVAAREPLDAVACAGLGSSRRGCGGRAAQRAQHSRARRLVPAAGR